MSRIQIVLLIALVSSCARTPTSPERSLRASNIKYFPDDQPIESLLKALRNTKYQLDKKPRSIVRAGKKSFSHEELSFALGAVIKCGKTKESLNKVVREYFDQWEVFGKNKWGEILMTSYYEPVLNAALTKSKKYSTPIYSPPRNLVEIKLSSFEKEEFGLDSISRKKISAQVIHGENGQQQVIPLPSREDIDYKKALSEKNLEIAYADPIDVFFLHIQGSGILRLKNNREIRLGYAAQNGMKYEPIGKYMKDLIPPEKMSMQSIEDTLRKGGEEYMREMFVKNPSYVFFKKLPGRSLTTLGTEVTDLRTIAVDRQYFPLGLLAHLSYPDPTKNPEKLSQKNLVENQHFTLTQDTGGAIKGPGRADLFWGKGSTAKSYAGKMRHPAKMKIFTPNEILISYIKSGKVIKCDD